jgi:LuxR family maltose regulon positive regulatory protein
MPGNWATASGPEQLTSQEERILTLFVNGLSKKEIADQLFISVNTVKTHLQHIYQKLNISSRAEARTIVRQVQR